MLTKIPNFPKLPNLANVNFLVLPGFTNQRMVTTENLEYNEPKT